jgi:hypothetical protein
MVKIPISGMYVDTVAGNAPHMPTFPEESSAHFVKGWLVLLYTLSATENPRRSDDSVQLKKNWTVQIKVLSNQKQHKWGQSNTPLLREVTYYVPLFVTPPNQPQWCILTDYFNNYNFSKLK